jgi:hypothetical protein
MVVPVFTISCHVSENRKNGPLRAHATITAKQNPKLMGRPVTWATQLEKLVKTLDVDICSIPRYPLITLSLQKRSKAPLTAG